MSKQFVVRLRKGSPTGNIVANSQVITINPLSGSTIFPSNFSDGRLQGKVTTNNRVANFLKTIMGVPPTSTTTSTSTSTTSTTSTTTRGPGTTTTSTSTSTSTSSTSTSTTSTSTSTTSTTTTTTQAPPVLPINFSLSFNQCIDHTCAFYYDGLGNFRVQSRDLRNNIHSTRGDCSGADQGDITRFNFGPLSYYSLASGSLTMSGRAGSTTYTFSNWDVNTANGPHTLNLVDSRTGASVYSFTLTIAISVSQPGPFITNWNPNPSTNQINELAAREFAAAFTVSDTTPRTIYWKVVGNAGISIDDFDGPTYGNFQTEVGTVVRNLFVRARSDAIIESSETFSIMFFLSQSDANTNSGAFFVSPLITIDDGSSTINETIRIADADIPPYYAGSSITFVVAGAIGGSVVDFYDGVTRYPAGICGSDGSLIQTLGPFNDIRAWTMEATFRGTGHVRTVSFNISQRPATGGAGSGCPDPLTLIHISPDRTQTADSLQVGDYIYTVHEQTLEYGYFAITHAEIIEQPKLGIVFDNGTELIVSLSHKFLVPGGLWVSAHDLRPGHQVESMTGAVNITTLIKHGVGPVVKLEVDQAHTYIAAGMISHNVKSSDDRTSVVLV